MPKYLGLSCSFGCCSFGNIWIMRISDSNLGQIYQICPKMRIFGSKYIRIQQSVYVLFVSVSRALPFQKGHIGQLQFCRLGCSGQAEIKSDSLTHWVCDKVLICPEQLKIQMSNSKREQRKHYFYSLSHVTNNFLKYVWILMSHIKKKCKKLYLVCNPPPRDLWPRDGSPGTHSFCSRHR